MSAKGNGKGNGGSRGRGGSSGGGDWRSKLKKNSSEIQWTKAAVPVVIVASDSGPMGAGIPGKILNYDTKEALHRMLSDVDDFTFLFCWYEGYWAYVPCGSNLRRCCCTCRHAVALPRRCCCLMSPRHVLRAPQAHFL
jgi:hypothetical protein